MSNVKNYTEQGGEKTVIGGEILITGKISVDEAGTAEGFVTPAENQADSEASTIATLKEDFNGLLSKLKAAGLMKADPEPPEDNGDEEPEEPGGE